ncbi:glycosyltransferase [Halosimplex amylolyticum]|uniref:glycosyltransferase n=1 Tax=Halosimplex amylolyticum TaxID=3396616 RepID=UPI003F545644
MDILHVNKYYYPHFGGIESVVKTLADGTVRARHQVNVLATTQKAFGRRRSVDGVAVHEARHFGTILSVPIAPSFPLRYAHLASDADVVHHHLPNPLSVVSHLISPVSGAATVATYHSDIVRQSRVLGWYEPFIDRFLQSLDHVFVTSRPLLEQSPHLEGIREKCSIVPLSVDTETFAPSDEVQQRDGSSDDAEHTILFVGRLNYYKGVSYLIKAMADVDAELIVVGDGERRADLESAVSQYDVADQVQFLGEVSEKQLHECYQAADVFVLPSTEPSEAFGVVQLEAMAYEIPVINTDLQTGVPWVSLDGVTGITVPPEDAGAIADAINELIAEPDRRTSYGVAARERVLDKFTEERMIAETLDRYQTVV